MSRSFSFIPRRRIVVALLCVISCAQAEEPKPIRFVSDSDDPLYLYSTTILDQEVRVIDFDSGGVPFSYVTTTHIGINKEFLEFPIYVKEALIAHEMGHLALGHPDAERWLSRDWYYALWKTADPWEIEADLWAVDLVGEDTVLRMLVYSHQLCVMIGASGCANETPLRIESLSYKMCTYKGNAFGKIIPELSSDEICLPE